MPRRVESRESRIWNGCFFSGSLEEVFFHVVETCCWKSCPEIKETGICEIVEAAHLMKEWLRRGYTPNVAVSSGINAWDAKQKKQTQRKTQRRQDPSWECRDWQILQSQTFDFPFVAIRKPSLKATVYSLHVLESCFHWIISWGSSHWTKNGKVRWVMKFPTLGWQLWRQG